MYKRGGVSDCVELPTNFLPSFLPSFHIRGRTKMPGMASQTLRSVTFATPLVSTPGRWKAGMHGKKRIVPSLHLVKSDSLGEACGYQPVRAFFPNPAQEPILREALKEPVAFLGGMFAGLLRLDLNEEPLREWVARMVETSGMNAEDISERDAGGEEGEMPQQIEIE